MIVPAIIASDQKTFDKLYSKLKIAKTLHLDIMDGDYVRNRSLWFGFNLPKHDYEAHLMTRRPEMFIGKHHSEIKTFIVHVETVSNVDALIDFAHSMKCRIFLALSPNIPVARIRKYIRRIDGITIMTVIPGSYGASFMKNMLKKIRELKYLNKRMTIEVDGGVNDKTISLLREAGANRFSVGSYLQKAKDIKKAIASLE